MLFLNICFWVLAKVHTTDPGRVVAVARARVGVGGVLPAMPIKFVVLVNKQGQTRVAQYYQYKVGGEAY